MPRVDFNRVRAEFTMKQVLSLLALQPSNRSGAHWYGSCPLQEPTRRGPRRSFSVNVAFGRYDCHGCHSHVACLFLVAAETERCYRKDRLEGLGTLFVRLGLKPRCTR
jgi:hypothetical protein